MWSLVWVPTALFPIRLLANKPGKQKLMAHMKAPLQPFWRPRWICWLLALSWHKPGWKFLSFSLSPQPFWISAFQIQFFKNNGLLRCVLRHLGMPVSYIGDADSSSSCSTLDFFLLLLLAADNYSGTWFSPPTLETQMELQASAVSLIQSKLCLSLLPWLSEK